VITRLVVSYFNWIWRHSRLKTTAAQRCRTHTQHWTCPLPSQQLFDATFASSIAFAKCWGPTKYYCATSTASLDKIHLKSAETVWKYEASSDPFFATSDVCRAASLNWISYHWRTVSAGNEIQLNKSYMDHDKQKRLALCHSHHFATLVTLLAPVQ